jgi:catechol 2,3-dioxygenase-like lactoylglutathione lyase family enzyme
MSFGCSQLVDGRRPGSCDRSWLVIAIASLTGFTASFRSMSDSACEQRLSLLFGDSVRIGSIVIHCHEFDRMVTFWQNALGYVPRRPAKDGWVVLRDPQGKGPNLSFQARQTRMPRRSWLHLDLYTESQNDDVNRLLQLGARRYPWRYRPGSDFVVLEDPDGNLFCVVQLP